MKRNFAQEREFMVTAQLACRDITDQKVLEVMGRVPREKFVPAELLDEAYADHPLSIGYGQTISQPYMVALMTQSLGLTGQEKVLEVGTGSGYQTAILAEVARVIYTVERVKELTERAKITLSELGYKNIRFLVGDGTLGWKEEAPFDRIMVTAGAPKVPPCLFAQLAEGGKMVVPVGAEFGQDLLIVEKREGKAKEKIVCRCVFVKLLGEEGWPG
jgi:protein-L-isoaspartate(D-aspartate) O-methyltransferase